MDDFQRTRTAALSAVRVPQHVIQLLADLRSYLQDKIEPPVYVSDRRLVKAVALMQVGCVLYRHASLSLFTFGVLYCEAARAVVEYVWQQAGWVSGTHAGLARCRGCFAGLAAWQCRGLFMQGGTSTVCGVWSSTWPM
eukprot:GHRQ01036610.1.p1 GENE.GHRQ01036610.1~~GHRQ01036610.1.p1  ORF type:complete len:138 (-),score=36.08 GHRQ01036610.1:264-677(-)